MCTRTHAVGSQEACNMLDLFFLILTAIFFVGCLAYIVACERL
jgi:preprotein translocase subunit SecG